MRNSTGLTLIELMIALVIFAIITFVAIPSFSGLLERKSLPQVAKALEKAIQVARTEATTRSEIVNLSPSNTSWNNGWVVTRTNDDSSQEILHSFPQTFPDINIISNEYKNSIPIIFQANGQVNSIGLFNITSINNTTNCSLTINILASGLVQKRFSQC